MFKRYRLSVINIVALFAVIGYVHFKTRNSLVYISNQEIFNQFKGKELLEQRLSALKNDHKHVLDSLFKESQEDKNSNVIDVYKRHVDVFALQEQKLSEQYTADIWARINQYVAEYGKENGCQIILGASGNGSLMYASEKVNVTEQVVKFINDRYEGR